MTKSIYKLTMFLGVALPVLVSCNLPKDTLKTPGIAVPSVMPGASSADTLTVPLPNWKAYFNDPLLSALIDSALQHNQELNGQRLEVAIAQNEIKVRKGEYLPFVNAGLLAGADKPGRFTRAGAVEDQLNIEPNKAFPEPLPDFTLGLGASWEADIWHKLHNAQKAATERFLAANEGRRFFETQLVAEIAATYYELLALDNQRLNLEKNSEIQANALRVVKQQKEAARVSQLAVNRFEAQWLRTQNQRFQVQQAIVAMENKLARLTGQIPTQYHRNPAAFFDIDTRTLQPGNPWARVQARPDVARAEKELAAANLDVKVARAAFYPSLRLNAALGFQAFRPSLVFSPESLLFSLAGELMAPLINKNALKANFSNSRLHQEAEVVRYEQTVLQAYTEVLTFAEQVHNYQLSFDTKTKEVAIMQQAITVANQLFTAARADYAEVLLTQREALEAKQDLIEVKLQQLQGKVQLYRSLGGGWQ